MWNTTLNKKQIGVLLALLAVVVVSAAVYVYRANVLSEPFVEGVGLSSPKTEIDKEDEDDTVVSEGFAPYR